MDPSKNPPPTTPAAGGTKKSTGIPTRSSGIPAPAVRRSVAPGEVAATPSATASSSSQSAAGAAAAGDDATSSSSSKLQTSSSQKSIPGSQLKPPSAITVPSQSSLSASSSSSSVHQTTSETTTTRPASSAALVSDGEVEALKSQVKDLSEKLETLKMKRAEDRDKLREAEKWRIQIQQLNEFKTQAQEIISNLNKEVQQTKAEANSVKEQYESYKETMNSHEQRLEEMTVDKELAEEKLEELQDEIVKLSERNEELKLELDVLKGEIEMSGVEGAATSFQDKQAQKEIENLKAALIKLRDMNLADKTEITRLKKTNEETTTKLAKLQKENEQLKADSVDQLAQINDLKDQVTATLGSVQMIEQLTEQNLDLEEKLAELREANADLEAINEVNDQLQESAREEERELRRTLDLTESRVRESERQIEQLKYSLADQEKTIFKFRELVKQLQDERDLVTRKLKSKMEEKIEQDRTAKQDGQASGTFDFKQKFIETQNRAIQVENELNRIELSSNRKYITHLLSFFPENFVKQSGENECLLSLLFFKRISSKCEFLMSHFKEKILNECSPGSMASTNGGEEVSSKSVPINSQVEFYFNLTMYSALIKLVCNKFDHVLNNCDIKVLKNIGSMYYDFNLNEKNFEAMFELMQKDQLDETFSFENLDRTFVHFDNIYKNHLVTERIDQLTYLDDFLNSNMITSETIGVVLKRLEKLIETKEDSAEIILLFKEIACKNDENKQYLKKLQRQLQKDEKLANKVTVELPNELVGDLDKALSNSFLVLKTFKDLYNLISSHKTVSSGDSNEITTAKQIEELAYQACDKIYLKDDNGPYENLRNSVKQIKSALERLGASLEHGEYEKKMSEEEYKIKKYQVNCPILKSAESYKNTLIEAENIKYKLEAKDDEIKELKKTLKLKSDDLSEQKLRISLVEKKGETQIKELDELNKRLTQEYKDDTTKKEKEHSHTVEALQQEIDNLQNERRDLKEQLKNALMKNIIGNIVRVRGDNSETASDGSGRSNLLLGGNHQLGGSADTLPLIYELNMMRSVNRLLQKNLMELNKHYARSLCDKLSSLPAQIDRNAQQASEDANYRSLVKKSHELMTDVFSSFGSFKIENLRDKSARSSDNKKNNISLIMIKSKISSLEGALHAIKQQTNKTSSGGPKKKLIAEISLPPRSVESSSPNGVGRTYDLNLNLDDIKTLLRKI